MKTPSALLGAALAAVLTFAAQPAAIAGNGQWTLLGWNNLGMHCMDDDYSVFSILPPYNTVNAQLIDNNGKLVLAPAGLTVTYSAIADLDGSINRTSAGKSNFWTFAPAGYGVNLPMDMGLAGNAMPGTKNTPQPFTWNAGFNWFEAVGIPIIPIDDGKRANTYPMMRLTAKNSAGTVLATKDVVLPVSGEMDCRACHGSNAARQDARPKAGWVNDPVATRDYRLNILRLHDEKHLASGIYKAALAANGFRADGMFNTATLANTPILCAKCHSSEALGTAGAPGVDPLTRSMHSMHASVVNPTNGLKLDDVANRTACYQCHPGSTTRCLRGAMGSAVAQDGSMAMQCQSCHGLMSQVGAATRTGWLDEPGCQSCHTGSATKNNGQIRYTNAFDTNGSLRKAVSTLFATNPGTPAPGKSLYRFSKGHGGVQCEACHGSTHAEFPSAARNDNVQSVQTQGHVGALMDCTACHATMPNTINGGPHGMHPVSLNWVTDHADVVERGGGAQCQTCHGADYRGTVLSRAAANRTFTTKFGTKTFYRGYEVSCYVCHDGVNSSDPSTHTAPRVANASLAVPGGGSARLALGVTGAGSTVRINRQPAHGTVALNGRVATYFAEPGYVGPDNFGFIGSDSGGFIDSASNGVVSVTVNPFSASLDSDGDGITDLMEYAIGLSPKFPSTSGVTKPLVETFGGVPYITLSIARFLPPPDASLHIEVSSDHLNWFPATIVTSTPSLLKAHDLVPYDGVTHRYIRTRVTRP